jgi:Zn-dependent protease with chaperone function
MTTRTLILLFVLATPSWVMAQTSETLQGYAEWRRDTSLVVDGQVVTVMPSTKLKGKGITDLSSIPLGYEVTVKGMRLHNGDVQAQEIEAKPNGTAMFEGDILKSTNAAEEAWVKDGHMFEAGSDGSRVERGRIVEDGPLVHRARGILHKLAPPYVDVNQLRLRVVETKEWNAAAMGNGAIWINSGLLSDASDDEIAVVLGHELAHYTHEHSRRNARRGMWGQMITAGVQGALASGQASATRDLAAVAAAMSLSAWTSGYSRDLEDQADRVGLRYAHEAGYDVNVGPSLWARFRDKYGEQDKVTSFLVGTHSRPTDRIRNIERELVRNYVR